MFDGWWAASAPCLNTPFKWASIYSRYLKFSAIRSAFVNGISSHAFLCAYLFICSLLLSISFFSTFRAIVDWLMVLWCERRGPAAVNLQIENKHGRHRIGLRWARFLDAMRIIFHRFNWKNAFRRRTTTTNMTNIMMFKWTQAVGVATPSMNMGFLLING